MANSNLCPRHYGAVVFDHPEIAAGGWACVAGGDPFRIESTGDLSSDIIWYTNIQMATFYQKGFRQSPKLRPEGFLRTQFNSLLIELGLKTESIETQVMVIAGLMGNVMSFAYLHLGLVSPPVGALNNGLRQSCLPSDPRLPPQILTAGSEASQSFVECEKRTLARGAMLVSLVFHRATHAELLLSRSYPSGGWSEVSAQSIPPSSVEGFRAWQSRVNRPGLFQVSIQTVSPVINHLINYGAGAGMEVVRAEDGARYVTYKRRCFMTTEELEFMLQYAEIDIEKVYLCDGYGPPPITLPSWGGIRRHSFAYGLYCENLWTSLTRSLDGKAAKSPLSAWLHAYDRLECLAKAIRIDREYNVPIHSYGYGRITLVAPSGDSSLVSKIAQEMSLVSPMVEKGSSSIYEVDAKKGPAALMQAAMDRRAREFLCQIDDRALNDAIECRHRAQAGGSHLKISL